MPDIKLDKFKKVEFKGRNPVINLRSPMNFIVLYEGKRKSASFSVSFERPQIPRKAGLSKSRLSSAAIIKPKAGKMSKSGLIGRLGTSSGLLKRKTLKKLSPAVRKSEERFSGY